MPLNLRYFFQFGSNPNNGAKIFSLGGLVLRGVIWHFFGDLSQSEKLPLINKNYIFYISTFFKKGAIHPVDLPMSFLQYERFPRILLNPQKIKI